LPITYQPIGDLIFGCKLKIASTARSGQLRFDLQKNALIELHGATVRGHRDYVLALALAFALLFAFPLAFAFSFSTAFTSFAPLPAATSLVGSPPQSRRDISKALISASSQRSIAFLRYEFGFAGFAPSDRRYSTIFLCL
jgi:hypothetical protein